MKYISALAITMFHLGVQGRIVQIKSLEQIRWRDFDKSTWIVFDVDNTILRQDHMIGTHQWGDYMKEKAKKEGKDETAALKFQHKSFAEVQPFVRVVAVEKIATTVLEDLTVREVPTFALTARSENLKDITLKQLKLLGFEFKPTFPKLNSFEGVESHFSEGVLFADGSPKGELLMKIVNQALEKPKKIIFVDDRLYNLESIEKSFKGTAIKIETYRYGAADDIVKKFDSSLAEFEYCFFKSYGTLMPTEGSAKLKTDFPSLCVE